MTNMTFPLPINNEVPYGTEGSTPVLQMSHPTCQRIQTIKALRVEFGWGLRQAKDFVEYGLSMRYGTDMRRAGMIMVRVLNAMKRDGLPLPTFRYVAQKPKLYVGEPVSFEGDDCYNFDVKCPS
jgi:hypothetical protein